ALQVLDNVEQRIQAGAPSDESLPRGDESSQHRRIDGLDLLPQLRERAPANRLQDIGIAPLAAAAARPELPFEQTARSGERLHQRIDNRAAETIPLAKLIAGERSVC